MKWIKTISMAVLAIVLAFIGIIYLKPITAMAEGVPTAWIAGYVDESTTNLRASQILEVRTSGFSDKAILSYHYYSGSSRRYQVFNESFNTVADLRKKLSEGGLFGWLNKAANAATSGCVEEYECLYPYFAIIGRDSGKLNVRIIVTDINSYSPTYRQSAETQYGNFGAANLSMDIGHPYGLFEGESTSLTEMLQKSGVAHIYPNYGCANISELYLENVDDGVISWTGERNNVVVKANTPGLARMQISLSKSDLCLFHDGRSGSGVGYIFVFKRPVVTPIDDGFDLTNTQAGVTYTIKGNSQTAAWDGQLLSFRGLADSTKYTIELSKVLPDGLKVKKNTYGTTLAPYQVSFSYQVLLGASSWDPVKVKRSNVETISRPVGPYAYGAVMADWYTDPAKTIPYNFNSYVTGNMILYGKWIYLKSSVRVIMDLEGTPYSSGTVELRQFERNRYTLNEISTGVYGLDNAVENGTYEIYVNGNNACAEITINTQKKETDLTPEQLAGFSSGETYYVTVPLKGLRTTIMVDDVVGENGTVSYKKEGKYSLFATYLPAEKKYLSVVTSNVTDRFDIYHNGWDIDVSKTGTPEKDISVDSPNKTIKFYTITLHLKSDIPYDADVTLRDAYGGYLTDMVAGTYNPVTCIRDYTYIMAMDQGTNPTPYTIYIDNVDTKNVVYALPGKCTANAEIYTAAFDVTKSGSAWNDAEIKLYNGTDSYILKNGTGGHYTAHVMKNIKSGTEIPYNYTIVGTVDKDIEERVVSSVENDIDLTYHVMNFWSYKTEDEGRTFTLESKPYRTQIIRDGISARKMASPYISGLTFDCWSESQWSLGTSGATSFDLTQSIMTDHTLYAHFKKPGIEINGFVKTNEQGNIDGEGAYYRMMNLVISGFDDGQVIKSLLLNTTETREIIIPPYAGAKVQVENETAAYLTENKTTTGRTISVQFDSKVTMTEAQNYLRALIVKPNLSVQNGITIVASDGVIQADGSGSIIPSQCTDAAWTKLSSLTGGSGTGYVLNTGKYYIDQNVTFTNSNVGGSGLTINGTVELYIPSGITLTAIGHAASGMSGGGAGILLTNGNTLILYGNGTVKATGGNAANGGSGTFISDGMTQAHSSAFQRVLGSAGGSGGNGGGGAGAGIGSAGGNGGRGGVGGERIQKVVDYDARDLSLCFDGNNGGNGSNGLNAGDFGTFKKSGNVKVNAKGGTGGESGGAIATGTASITGDCEDSLSHYFFGFGNCGGGGGSGWPGADIGTGGTGGGGGGGGGSGGMATSVKEYKVGLTGKKRQDIAGDGLAGGSGGAGNGYVCGVQLNQTYKEVTVTQYTKEGVSSWNSGASVTVHGGSGGTAGASTNASVSKTPSLCTLPTGQITFSGAAVNGTFAYNFDTTSKTYEIPDYDVEDGIVFVGWKIKTYAKNVFGTGTAKKWTTAESGYYVPGETVTIADGTYGTIELVPVTIGVTGKFVQDEMVIPATEFVPSPEPIEYHEYIINTTLNDEDMDIGIITLVDTNDSNHVINIGGIGTGKYTYISEEDTSFKIYLNGVNSDVGVVWLHPASVAARSTTVTVLKDDEKNTDRCLVTLSNDEGDYDARAYYVEGENSGEYSVILLTTKYTNPVFNIVVDGMKTSQTVDFNGDNTETVELYTVEATVNANVEIDTVEIKTIGQEPVSLEKQEDTNIYQHVGLMDETTEYTVAVNGFDSDKTVKFNSENRKATLDMHILTVETYLNNSMQDIDNYKPVYQGVNMKSNGTGRYTIAEFGEVKEYVIIDQEQPFVNDAATLYYYSVTYHLENGEEGETPIDPDYYLSGTDLIVASAKNIRKEGFLFAGWKETVTGDIYFGGEKLRLTNHAIDLTAQWKNKEEFPVIVYYHGEEYYLFPEQIPEILEERNYPESGKDEPGIEIIITGGNPLIEPIELPDLYLGPKDTLTILGPAEVTIPEDSTIINEGTIIIDEGDNPDNPGKLIIKGEIINKGDIENDGEIDVIGKFTNDEEGTLENDGNIIIDEDGGLENKSNDDGIINRNIIYIDGGELINKPNSTLKNEGDIFLDDGGKIQNEGIIENSGGLREGDPDGDRHHTGDPVGINNDGIIRQRPEGEIGTKIENDEGVITGGKLIDPGEIIGGIIDEIIIETENEPIGTTNMSGNSKEPDGGGKLPKDPTQEKIDEIFGPGNAYLLVDEDGNPILDEDGSYTIVIIRGLTLEEPIEVPEGVDVKIELEGRNLTGPDGDPAIIVTGGKLEIHDETGEGSIIGGKGDPNGDNDGGEGIIITGNSNVIIDEEVTVRGGLGGEGGDGGNGGTGILVDMPEDGDGYIEISGKVIGGGGNAVIDNGDKPGNGGKGIEVISAPEKGVVIKESENGLISGGDGGDNLGGNGGDGGDGVFVEESANPDLLDLRGAVNAGIGGLTPPGPDAGPDAWKNVVPSGSSGIVASGKRAVNVILKPGLVPSATIVQGAIVEIENGAMINDYTIQVKLDRSDLYKLPKTIAIYTGSQTMTCDSDYTYDGGNSVSATTATIVLKQGTQVLSLDGDIIIELIGKRKNLHIPEATSDDIVMKETKFEKNLPNVLPDESDIGEASDNYHGDDKTDDIQTPDVKRGPTTEASNAVKYILASVVVLSLLFIRRVKYVFASGSKTRLVFLGSRLRRPQFGNGVLNWYKDSEHREIWDFDYDRIKKNTTLYG